MNDSKSRRAWFVPALASAVSIALLSACGESGSEPVAFPEPDQIYSDVRGRVTALPSDGPAAMPLSIKHEAIPEFIGSDGVVYVNRDGTPGMKAMDMPFPEMAETVSLDELAVGEPVAFEFAVAWDGTSPRYWVTSIEPLPMDTELELPGEAPIDDAAEALDDDATDDASSDEPAAP
jgi:hypothetical protein